MWLDRVGWRAIAHWVVIGTASLATAACTPARKDAQEESGSAALIRAGHGDGLVISQIYGGAGAAAAVWNRDYVELFNRTTTPIRLRGLSIHYAGPSGDFGQAAKLPDSASIAPGGYYLVGFAAGEAGADLRTDAAGLAVNILPTSGKVALVRDVESAEPAAQQLGCGRAAIRCQSDRIVDLVGYGFASDQEGKLAAPAAAVASAVQRKGAGCFDTDDNANDFEPIAPVPRTSESPAHPCDVRIETSSTRGASR
jgi:uncharacterized protein